MSEALEAATPVEAVARRQPNRGLLLGFTLTCVMFVYSGVLDGGFVWDDHSLIEREAVVREMQPVPSYFGRTFWANPEYAQTRSFYRPIITLSYALEWKLWDGDPLGFHATNLAVHLICCTLVFLLCLRGGASGIAAALAALLFGISPRLTESVAWISGRTDVFASAFALSAWLVYRCEPERWGRRVVAAALLCAGLFCKEVATAGLVAIAGMEFVYTRRHGSSWRAMAWRMAPALVGVALYTGLRLYGLAHTPPSAVVPIIPPLFPYRAIFLFQALGTYTAMVIDALRPRLQVGTIGVIDWHWVALGVVAGLGYLALLVRLVRRNASPMVLAGTLSGLFAISLVLHLIHLPINVVAADRFLYFPLAGGLIAAASASRSMTPRVRRAALAVALVAVPAFAVATQQRSGAWNDELELWQTAVERAPRMNGLPWALLGEVLYERDRIEDALHALSEAGRLEAALMQHYEYAGGSQSTRGNIALCLSELGDFDRAIPLIQQLVAENPKAALNRFNLALAWARVLRWDDAERELDVAVQIYPGYPRALELQEQIVEARTLWESLPEPEAEEPTDVLADRGRVFSMLGRVDAANHFWGRVIKAPDADEEQLRSAALFLVVRGDSELAEQALVRLRSMPEHVEEAKRLEQALAHRRLVRGETEPS